MLSLSISLFVLLLGQTANPPSAPPPPTTKQAVPQSADVSSELGAKLSTVRRIYVDSFGDDPISKQIQAMVITSLSGAKRFIVTENKDKADAILKGAALEKTSQEFHATSEGTAAGRMAAQDSSASTETVNAARVAVRLTSADGDVIWTTTQESHGAKYKGASADVADKVVKQLLRDLEKLESPPQPATSPADARKQ